MKKKLALLLAVVMVVALFAGCGGGDTGTTTSPSGSTTSPSGSTTSPSGGTTTSPSGSDTTPSGDTTPAGGEQPASDVPTEMTTYDLPLTNEAVTFTRWSVDTTGNVVNYWGDYNNHPAWAELEKRTGVHIDFMIQGSTQNAQTSFAVLLASDDLCDMTVGASSYCPSTLKVAVLEEEIFVNIYDYKEYCPNYIYIANNTDFTQDYRAVYEEPDCITSLYGFLGNAHNTMGFGCRSDIMEGLGMTVEDLLYYDGVHEYLLGCKTEYGVEYPMFVPTTLDGTTTIFGSGYDVKAYCNPSGNGANFFRILRLVDGTVELSWLTEDNRAYIEMLNQWYTEGLINPDFMAGANDTKQADTVNGRYAYVMMSANNMKEWPKMSAIEGMSFTPVYKAQRVEGQVFHVGRGLTTYQNGTCISTLCEDIPLLLQWADYAMSDDCTMLRDYGIEDLSYYIDETDGKAYFTEVVTNNPDGYSFSNATSLYRLGNSVYGVLDYMAQYQYKAENYEDSGAWAWEVAQTWATQPEDESYVFPNGIALSTEAADEFNQIFADLDTYVIENYFTFVVGDRPMSEWDSFIQGMKDMGVDRCVELYQEAYDDYVARFGEISGSK